METKPNESEQKVEKIEPCKIIRIVDGGEYISEPKDDVDVCPFTIDLLSQLLQEAREGKIKGAVVVNWSEEANWYTQHISVPKGALASDFLLKMSVGLEMVKASCINMAADAAEQEIEMQQEPPDNAS